MREHNFVMYMHVDSSKELHGSSNLTHSMSERFISRFVQVQG